VNNLTKYRAGGFEDLEAITFDHFNTLLHQTNEGEEDIIYPIIRALQEKMHLDEKRFIAAYTDLDRKYRQNMMETFLETELDEIVYNALVGSGHLCSELAEMVEASVDAGLASRQLTWFPDARDTLFHLKEEGYTLGLISNTHWRWTPGRWRQVQPFFDVITLSYEHGYVKPHPSIFQKTLYELNVKPGKCLHVGDDPYADVQGAKSVGMKTTYC